MKREALATAGLVSALVLTGCSNTHETPKAQLPKEIAQAVPGNVMQLETNDIQGAKRAASAVRVAIGQKTMVLTAAHMLNGGMEQCGDEKATQASTGNDYYSRAQTPVVKSTNDAWNGMGRFDAAVIRTTEDLSGGPAFKLAAESHISVRNCSLRTTRKNQTKTHAYWTMVQRSLKLPL